MILQNDYFEIKEFLRHRVYELNCSDNYEREKQRNNNTKYSLPSANVFGWMPAIELCYGFDVGSKQTMYILPFLAFYRCLSEYLPRALQNFPDLFGTKDAKDVIAALYSVSGYDMIGNINDYEQFLIDKAYCFFLLRDEKGILNDKIFRLDLFRHILPNNNGYDFNGGLMHAFRHCSWNGLNLSSGNGETSLNNIWDLPIILGKAILLDKNDEIRATTYNDNGKIWRIIYYIDPETNIYYLKTAFVQ